MNGFFDPVLSQLMAGLELAQNESNLIRRYDRCLRLVKAAMTELKQALRFTLFSGKEAEVQYFRDQAPIIYSRLFYFIKLRVMEVHRANLSRESFRREVEKEMDRIEEFYGRHRQVLQWTAEGGSYWDGCLYTRQGFGEWWAEEEGLYIDEDFTIGSYWVAKNAANRELQLWLSKELEAPPASEGVAEAQPVLRWTGKQVELIELVYGLHLAGCFNNGKASWKETIEGFGLSFGIDVGNYNVAVQEMARRKIAVAKFLDKVAEGLRGKLGDMG